MIDDPIPSPRSQLDAEDLLSFRERRVKEYNRIMPALREIQARSILTRSGIADFAVNCYVGCTHNCVYCYARFMKKFTGHEEPWGQFLDIKINAPEVLAREVKRRTQVFRHFNAETDDSDGTVFRELVPETSEPDATVQAPRVFVSSVCDAYQPAEKRYRLTRQCVKILIDAGFHIGILTKSKLVARDFDILRGHPNCDLGCTLTTMNEQLRFRIEPGASPTRERIAVLEQACEQGIDAWAFLGPFMPGLSDTDEALDALISAVAPLPLTQLLADKLNPRPGVFDAIVPFLRRYHPDLIDLYRRLFFDKSEYRAYCEDLSTRLRKIAEEHGVGEKIRAVW